MFFSGNLSDLKISSMLCSKKIIFPQENLQLVFIRVRFQAEVFNISDQQTVWNDPCLHVGNAVKGFCKAD